MQIHEDHLVIVKAVPNGDISNEIVMASAAGWYIGNIYRDKEHGYLMPNARNTDYMSKELAMEYWNKQYELETTAKEQE